MINYVINDTVVPLTKVHPLIRPDFKCPDIVNYYYIAPPSRDTTPLIRPLIRRGLLDWQQFRGLFEYYIPLFIFLLVLITIEDLLLPIDTRHCINKDSAPSIVRKLYFSQKKKRDPDTRK